MSPDASGAGNLLPGVMIQKGAQLNDLDSNIISGNGGSSGSGVIVTDAGTEGNAVTSNTIGADVNGTALPNAFAGLALLNGAAHTEVALNTISGNGVFGLWVTGTGTDSSDIFGNSIGILRELKFREAVEKEIQDYLAQNPKAQVHIAD